VLKKETLERRGQTRLKFAGDKKPPVNRKLLVWVFVLTGLVSLFFWWRGREMRGNLPLPDTTSDLHFVIKPTEKIWDRDSDLRVEKILTEIKEITATASGTYVVYVYHLDDGTAFGINETVEMPGASIMKIPVMITAVNKIEKGELRFEDRYILEEADRAVGSGPLQFKQAGTSYSIDQLLSYLGKNSDNTAWVMFNRRWGKPAIEDTIVRLGMTDSNYDQLTTTAVDVAKMWKYLYDGPIIPANKMRIWGYLTESIYEDRIPAGLAGTGAEIMGHKVGTDADVWADAGIIKCEINNPQCTNKPFIIMNKEVKRAEATGIVPKIAKLIWEFENRNDD
jgi:hypothetical protein